MDNCAIFMACDGGAIKNGAVDCVASYSYCIVDRADLDTVWAAKNFSEEIDCYECSGIVPNNGTRPSNNRGELLAIIEGLQRIIEECLPGDIVIISDSKYSIMAIDIWSRKWGDDPSKFNLDLICKARQIIDELRKSRRVSLVHVRGHQKEPPKSGEQWLYWYLNGRADYMCQRELAKNKDN